MFCKVADNKFSAAGGPQKLEEIINEFLKWAAA
ncbi:Imm53 family immunity protein [Lysobacter sp. TAF61]